MNTQKRYWLRGGIFLGSCYAVTIIFLALPFLLYSVGFIGSESLFIVAALFAIISFPGFLILEIIYPNFGFNDESQLMLTTCSVIVALVALFLIGSILGWIYGKMKRRI